MAKRPPAAEEGPAIPLFKRDVPCIQTLHGHTGGESPLRCACARALPLSLRFLHLLSPCGALLFELNPKP